MVEIKAADLEVRCFFTWRMKGHNRFYGSVWKTPMGLEGSGAFRRPGSIVRVLRTERWVRPTERAGSEGSFICRCLGQRKPLQPPCGRGNAIPLWWLAPPPCPVGSMSLDSRVAYSSPMNPVPLPPPQFGGAAKGKRLNGQARRLTSPHLEVLCRTSTGALWVLSHGAMSLQESIETYSSP